MLAAISEESPGAKGFGLLDGSRTTQPIDADLWPFSSLFVVAHPCRRGHPEVPFVSARSSAVLESGGRRGTHSPTDQRGRTHALTRDDLPRTRMDTYRKEANSLRAAVPTSATPTASARARWTGPRPTRNTEYGPSLSPRVPGFL